MSKVTNTLIVGWEVTPNLAPKYWLRSGANPGEQQRDDVVEIEPETIAAHTIIIAQTGSGKSFFIGRLLEEILIKTKSRCLILDPNGDFLRLSEIESESLWENAAYDFAESSGTLPTERSRSEFEQAWKNIQVGVMSARTNMWDNVKRETFKVWWPNIPSSFFSRVGNSELSAELQHCHNVACSLFKLNELRNDVIRDRVNGLNVAEEISKKIAVDKENLEATLEKQFGLLKLQSHADKYHEYLQKEKDRIKRMLLDSGVRTLTEVSRDKLDSVLEKQIIDDMQHRITEEIHNISRSAEYTSEKSFRYYFGRIASYVSEGLVVCNTSKDIDYERRATVLDISSWKGESTKQIVISSAVGREWDHAKERWYQAMQEKKTNDTRVPLFVIIDEAHNVIPKNTDNPERQVVNEQIATIAAEGRKYGVFLTLITQRPDKLDQRILSECENIAVLKLNSSGILERTIEVLGIESSMKNTLSKCLQFERGRVLLLGKWKPGGEIAYSAARRTIEGGRNLRPEYWAVPS